MASIMDWLTLAATFGGMVFGAGIAWGVTTSERAATRRRLDAMADDICRLEKRVDGLYNGRANSNH